MMTAAPPGPYASYCASSYETPGSSPVPRRIARLMLSAGMFCALASAMIVRRRGFMSGSPPPARAATVNSLMMRVKTLPRLASAAPFLCLIVCHFEWPDMLETPAKSTRSRRKILSHGDGPSGQSPGQDDPDVGALVPGLARGSRREPPRSQTLRSSQSLRHLRNRQRPERQIESMFGGLAAAAFAIGPARKSSDAATPVLTHRFDERQVRAARRRGPSSEPCSRYSRQFGTSGTRSRPNSPPGFEHACDRSRASPSSPSRGASDCRMPYGASTIENSAGRNGSARISARISRTRGPTSPSLSAEAPPRGARRAPASAPIDRRRRATRRRAPAAAKCGPCRSRVRARAPLYWRATSRQNGTSWRPSVRAFSQS